MNRSDRIAAIEELLLLTDKRIEGRKKLHKIVYLLQKAGETFDQEFRYYHYGVFSHSLAYDLDYAKENGIIRESYADGLGYVIELPDVIGDRKSARSRRDSTSQLTKTLAGMSPQLLEALSTIVYLHSNYYSGENLKRKLRELKPNLVGQFRKAFALARAHYDIQL